LPFKSETPLVTRKAAPLLAFWPTPLKLTGQYCADLRKPPNTNRSMLKGIPASTRLSFRVFRNGTPLGTHQVSFLRDGETTVADIAIDYLVKFSFITMFKYRLRAREIWSGRRLVSVRANTDNNGKPEFMNANRDGDSLHVNGSRVRPNRAPDGAIASTHWNIGQLDAPMINPQDGTLMELRVVPHGESSISDTSGRTRSARHFSLVGSTPFELWYDIDDTWTALRARVEDGSVITYVRQS
jgi:hypothetical protein